MLKFYFILAIYFAFMTGHINAQCSADRTSVQDYIKQVKKENGSKPANGLKILEPYLAEMERCSYKNDSTHVYLLMVLAEFNYYLPDLLKAINCYQRSIDIINQNRDKPSINPKRLLSAYYWLSEMYTSLDNFPEKMKAVNNCINTALQLKDSANSSYLRCLDIRVRYEFDQGDYNRCISDAIMCEKVAYNYQRQPQADLAFSESTLLSSLAWRFNALLALKDFAAAEKFLEEKTRQYQKTVFDKFLGYLYAFQAETQMQKGDYTRALQLFQKGIDYSSKAGRYYTCKQILNLIGNKIYFTQYNDMAGAMKYYRAALAYTQIDKGLADDNKMESLNIFANIANVFTRQGRYDSAILYFRYAFDTLSPGLNETKLLEKPANAINSYKKVYYLQSLLLDKGDMFLQQYNTKGDAGYIREAVLIYKQADQLLDRIRGSQSDPESKLFWRRDVRRLYEHAIHACYLLGDAATAFYFFEKSRAVLLNDQLAQQQWMRASDISKLSQLKKQMSYLQYNMSRVESSSPEYDDFQSKLFGLRQELDNMDQQIKTQNPLYYQRNDTTHLSLAEAQRRLLKDHAGLLEIFSGDSANYTLFVTSGKAYLSKISKQDFDNTARSYMSYISNRERLNRDFAGFTNTAFRLYRLVFQNNIIPTGRIIISPDGPLFPFESLITDSSAANSYFLREHAVSYTYSARYLLNDFMSTTATSSGNLLGIAPVQYSAGSGLPALNGSDQSLEKLESYIGNSTVLVRGNASRHSFLQQFPSYKIIQLYTHAADSSDRKEPVIYFADSSLYLSDLTTEQLPVTQLIVLSACNTGIGKLYQGEGVFSFNRGFAALGIPSSVSNLWSIDNLSTYQLTEYFYSYLAKGLPIDEALQKAKLEFLDKATGEQKLPYHWAPAILIGKSNAIAYKKDSNWKMILLLATGSAVILLLGFLLYKRRRQS
jgi:CHAT domain-containing protein